MEKGERWLWGVKIEVVGVMEEGSLALLIVERRL